MVGGGCPLLPKFLGQIDPPTPSKTAIFNRYSFAEPRAKDIRYLHYLYFVL